MAVSMDKIIFHEHLEECCGPQPCHHFVQVMGLLFVVIDSYSFNVGLNQY